MCDVSFNVMNLGIFYLLHSAGYRCENLLAKTLRKEQAVKKQIMRNGYWESFLRLVTHFGLLSQNFLFNQFLTLKNIRYLTV